MASPTATQTALLDETEHHVAALEELVTAYEYGLRNAEIKRDRRLALFLAGRVAYHADRLVEARCRRDTLRRELQQKAETR